MTPTNAIFAPTFSLLISRIQVSNCTVSSPSIPPIQQAIHPTPSSTSIHDDIIYRKKRYCHLTRLLSHQFPVLKNLYKGPILVPSSESVKLKTKTIRYLSFYSTQWINNCPKRFL